ncbi:TetR/AcrR family transcriptional regulator [Candidatus Marimicrobium litorale]|uniref:TetR/AcrR family transcriptional regulator n=1 Tax=Candidatus Marimicrobium litorale TaxID=2518991 RepID=A0ABT3T9P9_9GAMM|nr:TetR/AcrR family transcriptional regulator [Candidatus Marimicrobium litorale]MCX2978915.1 TetR/AcrR family transcriptional regulator [Candidatus Marimicrobium litorale]
MSENRSKASLVINPQPSGKVGRTERARAEIQNAAIQFLWSRPFRDLTVDRLMQQTAFSRAAFYYHFTDLHELMETLLSSLEAKIMEGGSPWLYDDGDPVALLCDSLAAEVQLCFKHGPMLKAISDAAGADERLERAWYGMLGRFDAAVSKRIRDDQALGLVDAFDPELLAISLNQSNTALYVRAFGQKPRRQPGPVLEVVLRVWISSIYGDNWVTKRASTLHRKADRANHGIAKLNRRY